MIYLDHNATTPPLPQVFEAMSPLYKDGFGNASSVYQLGNQARVQVEKARGIVARSLEAMPSEITFTGSGTEADNMALFGAMFPHFNQGKNIIISGIEHPAIAKAAEFLTHFGVECRIAPVKVSENRVLLEPFLELMDGDTTLISCMFANNETGLILPIADLFREAKARGIICHTDAVQAFGKIPVSVKTLGADLLSLSAHKIYGPKGVGVLYIRRGTPFQPLIHGGAQENSRRPGTENVPGIVGMGTAVENFDLNAENPRVIRDYFEKRLESVFGASVEIHNQHLPRTPNTTSAAFKNCDGNVLLIKLDQRGICVSTGSACHSGALSTSSVLLQLGIPEELAKGTLRFSLSRWTTKDEIDEVIEALKQIV